MTSCWLRCGVWTDLPFMPGAAGTHLLGNSTGVSHLDAWMHEQDRGQYLGQYLLGTGLQSCWGRNWV